MMGSRNHIIILPLCLALIGVYASEAAAEKLSPFCEGLPADNVPFCSQVLKGESKWEEAVVKMILATMAKVKAQQSKAETIGEKLPPTIPKSDRADVAEKCKSGYNYALDNLKHSLKRIRRGVYVRTDSVVYTAWAGIYECSGALKHFNVDMNVEPFKAQDEAEKAVGSCHGAVSKALDSAGLTESPQDEAD
ncbi:uncharacterized protein LOC116026572 [Ipomoea triloba]|uniref:uncharacterized protein LOC116026572 n=1 Tax=Ipomoea triloba TaxID=35885 RepID=UPI00125DDEEF|nr:uncharacterized protein LOC116026572 [Ipomoea triloba]